MNHEEFGTAEDYAKAFAVVFSKRVHPKRVECLRQHYASPEHTTTWADLAKRVGYRDGNDVNLQYGPFAKRVALQLGLTEEPKEGFWLYVLAGWADGPEPLTTHTRFVLRRPVIEALTRLGILAHQSSASPRDPQVALAEEVIAPDRYWEGALRRITVNAYERDPSARRTCLEIFRPVCSACDFDFGAHYGEIGRGFIHLHHKRPLSEIREGYTPDPREDLVPVCPNCHAMLHTSSPPLTVEELREHIRRARGAA